MEQSSLELLIPAAKIEAVKKALQQAFNTRAVESIILLNGGYSGALVYKITVSDKPYVLRKAYFGDSLDDYKRARLFLMQQVCHMFYALGFLQYAAASRPPDSTCSDSMDTPRLRDVHEQIRTGNVSLTTHEGQLLYGKVRLNEALYNMKTPRFAESIDLIK